MTIKQAFRFISRYFRKYRRTVAAGIFIVLTLSLLILPTPLITRHVIDKTIPGKNFHELLLLAGLALLLLILTRIGGYVQNRLFFRLNNRVIIDIRIELLKKINRICFRTKQQLSNGYLIARINDDTMRLNHLFADTLISTCKDILTFLAGSLVLVWLHWKLAIITFMIIPVYFYVSLRFNRQIRIKSGQYFESSAGALKKLEECLSMVKLCKLIGRERFNIIRYLQQARISLYQNMKLGKISFVYGGLTGFIQGLAPVLILSYGGYEIISGRLSLGSFIAFSSFTGYLLGPASRLANLNLHLQKALKALERIAEILELPEEGKPSNRIILPDCFKLSFQQIEFSYEPGFRVLKGLDVELSSGERIGLMGGSGSGKTTLLHLICGLLYPDSGGIFLNGNILARNGLLGLRKQIAVVGHKAELFDDTIMNNILAGNSKASCHEVERFCRLVNAHEFITQFPEGYDTRIGFQGEYLSAGQQQRIALARALISKPRILILDEVTANVDGKSQNYLLRTIYSLPRNMLILMVSHRYSTIRDCDRVLILTDGKIRQIIDSDRSTAYYSDSRDSVDAEREGVVRR